MKTGFFWAIFLACCEKVTVTSSDAIVNCDVFEYYDVRDGACKHCDTACFERVNSTYIQFVESGCQEFCPGYMGQHQSASRSNELSDDTIGLSMIEGGMMGFIAALIIVSVIIIVIWRGETVRSLKGCCRRASGGKRLPFLVADNDDDFGETSYVSLSDPLDEVEMVYRVTCV